MSHELRGYRIAHFGRVTAWDPNYGLFGGQVEQPPGIMTRHASSCVPLCTNNFRNSPGLAFHRIPKARRIPREYVRLLRNADLKLNSESTRICILLVFLEVKSPQVHPPPALHFHVFFFQFHLLFCYFELF